jgi:YYY domain-containing protein
VNARSLTTRRATLGLLALTVVLAFGLRVQGLNWDDGAHLNPDERYLAIVNSKIAAPDGLTGRGGWFDTRHSRLNPLNHGEDYVYGTAPLFATKGLATWLHRGATTGDQPARAVVVAVDAVGIPLLDDTGAPRFDGAYQSHLVGRLLSAVLDSLTTLAVFELARLAAGRGRRGRAAGLAAALVWATCVLAIQYSHFFVVEATLTFATALALVAAAHLVLATTTRHRTALAVAAGLATGWAGASKITGLAVGLVVAGAALAHHWQRARRAGLGAGLGETAVAGAAALVTFRVLQPYAFDGLLRLDQQWRDVMTGLQDLQSGVDVPPNVQWADRSPVEAVDHLVRFGLGVPATLLAVVGVVGAVRARHTHPGRTGWPVAAVLLGWLVVVAGLFLPRFVVTMRYLLPAYPVLAAFAGCGAVRLLTVRRTAPATTSAPHPGATNARAVPAARTALEPAARRIAPVAGVVLLTGSALWGLAFVNGVYRNEHPRLTAARWMAEHVDPDAVLTVDEWDDALPFAEVGSAGFTQVPLRPFATQTADEVRALALTLADVDYVVQTSDRATASTTRVPGRYGPILRYQRALEDGSLGFEPAARFVTAPSLFGLSVDDRGSEEAFRVYDHPEVRIWRRTERFDLADALAILQPDRVTASVAAIPRDGAANGLLLRTGAASDPGADVGGTFRDTFPNRLPVAPVWWFLWFELTAVGALGWVSRRFAALPDRGIGLAKVFGPLTVAVPLWALVAWGLVPFSAVTAGLATVAAVGGGLAVPSWRAGLVDLWRHHRRALLTVEAVSLVAFLAVLALRSAVPDLWYHPTGGEKPFETAFFTSVARTATLPPADPWYSGGVMNYYYGAWFVLSVPTRLLGIVPEVALNLALATTASLVAAVTWSLGTALTHRPGAGRVRSWPGITAVGAVLVAGNLDAARQQIERLTTALGGEPAPPFDWWGVSRLNPPTTDINEFPAWSFLFGDPHPHVMALPVLLAVVTTAVAALHTARAGLRRDQLALAGLLGTGIGWVRVDHTWDLPLVAGLVVLAVATGHALAPGGRRSRLRAAVVDVAVVGAVAVVVSTPYVRAGLVFDRGFTAAQVRTPLGSFLLQYGTSLLVATAFVAYAMVRSFRSPAAPPVLRSGAGRLGVLALVVGMVLAVIGFRGPVATVGTVGAVLLTAVAARQLRHGDLARGCAAGVTAAGLALAVFPEGWTVVNDIGRQNTVFKFGYSAWVLASVGAAALGVALVDAARAGAAVARARPEGRWVRRATVGGLVVAVLPALVFWPSAAPPRIEARFAPLPATLDGRAWLRHGPVVVEANGVPPLDVTGDNALVDWLRAHGRTGETLVEATGPSYSWVARVSVATGLPTVIGWNFHQEQQRRTYAATVATRREAVDDLYRSGDRERILRVLATYRPDYVVIGSLERALGTPEGLAALVELAIGDTGDGGDVGLAVAFGSPGVGPDGDRTGFADASTGPGLVLRVDPPAIDRVLADVDAARLTASP